MGSKPPSLATKTSSTGVRTRQVPDGVVVNVQSCRTLAESLAFKTIPAAKEDSSLPGMSAKENGNFYFLLVAICYQTSPRGRPPLEGKVGGRHLHGWDYLSAKLEAAVHGDLALLSPRSWAHIATQEVQDLFRDDELGDRLTDVPGRALLIRDLGEKMSERSWDDVDQMYTASGGRIEIGEPNLLSLLAGFRTYSDPVRKKSFFFLELMRNAGQWSYVDPENLGAPIDYHEVRGHLRIGTVDIRDPDLLERVMEGREITLGEDVKIRQAVYQALMLVSEFSGLRNPGQLHYLFWNVFRSCCARERPHCQACPPMCPLPPRYVPLALFPEGVRRCPFSAVCKSAGRVPKLLEPVVQTDYY